MTADAARRIIYYCELALAAGWTKAASAVILQAFVSVCTFDPVTGRLPRAYLSLRDDESSRPC